MDPDGPITGVVTIEARPERPIGLPELEFARLVLELKDKLDFARGEPSSGVVSKPKPQQAFDGPLGTVHAALVQMGFRPNEAEQAIAQISPQADGKQTEELLREALSVLA